MKKYMIALWMLVFLLSAAVVQARPDIVEQYTEAVRTANVTELQKLLAPNYWHMSANGHIQDKEHFLESIKNGKMKITTLKIHNVRASIVGGTIVVTGNGVMTGTSEPPLPQGLMRYTLVVGDNRGVQQIVLFQATPVISTPNCKDGNCALR